MSNTPPAKQSWISTLSDPSHPIWRIARLSVLMVALVTLLYINSSHFDSTEWYTIIGMFLAAAGVEVAPTVFASRKQHQHRYDK